MYMYHNFVTSFGNPKKFLSYRRRRRRRRNFTLSQQINKGNGTIKCHKKCQSLMTTLYLYQIG